MSKLSLSIVMAFCAGILFSSCSRLGSIAISKRHYRSGFYVDIAGSKPQAPVQQRQAVADPEIQSAISTSAEDKKEVTVKESEVQAPVIAAGQAKRAKPGRKHAPENLYASAQDKSTTTEEIQSSSFKKQASSLPDVNPVSSSGGSSSDVPYWVLIVFCIILPPLAVGLKYGIVDKFWISLVLTLIFWLPGVIYALIVVA